jgi:hypothetical protein
MIPNGIPASETLASFIASEHIVELEIAPVKDAIKLCSQGSDICVCSPEDAQFWSIYGRTKEGFATLLHDISDQEEPGPIIQWLHDTLKLPVAFFSDRLRSRGAMPTLALAEWLTETIHDEIPGVDDAADFRDDDFENHALAPLRESLCLACGYNGDPIIHPEGAGT